VRPPLLRIHEDELIVDSFAGGGGASLGIEMALGRSPDIAINHDPEAIAMHAANHPRTRHYCESVWEVDPAEATGGRRVALAWFSPDCKHFSKAKGGKPVDKGIRGLAWVAIRWAKAVRPRVIILENVEEFQDWGPILADGRPCPERRGLTFRRWLAQLQNAGYRVELRELRACDYGAPTTRKRLFVVARSDGGPIAWPAPTHGPGREPYRTAAECIEWALPCPSIFDRARPLAENTQRRIARGLRRYVLEAAQPFIVPVTHQGDDRVHGIHEPMRTVTSAHRGESALVAPSLIQASWGEREGQAPRALDLHRPLGTVVAGGIKHALVAAFLAKHYGGNYNGPGSSPARPFDTVTTVDHHALVASHLLKLRGECHGAPVDAPAPTLTAGGTHLAEVRAFLLKYYGKDGDPRLGEPLHTVTTKDRFGLVTVHGTDYVIADIGMRMLVPRELARAQGFHDAYRLDLEVEGKPLSKTAQVRMIGNSVCPPLSRALVAAQFAEGARSTGQLSLFAGVAR
jgi:DNA (cytosine-5)-methyltransferase 1